MVRLKGRGLSKRRSLFKFQFHYGTIKSTFWDSLEDAVLEFQFHYGTIKSGGDSLPALNQERISIPLWYD